MPQRILTLGAMLLCVLLYACSSYGPYQKGAYYSTGYLDQEISPGIYRIAFHGSDYDNDQKLIEFWHRRARELCGSDTYKGEPDIVVTTTGSGTSVSIVAGLPVPVSETYWNREAYGTATCSQE